MFTYFVNMAGDMQSLALEKAELLSIRLKELVYSGQGFVQAQFGVDLGLNPELYPTWAILSTAVVGFLLLLVVSWAAVCVCGKKRGSSVDRSSEGEPGKADFIKSVKPEEHKKRSRKKASEKKTQSNGQPVVVAQEEVKEMMAASKISPQIKVGKRLHEVQAPVQVKKNKKKIKSDVKPVQQSSTNDGREPDDGVWETKVSNREKRQQRRKEKGSEDSGSSGGAEASKPNMEALVATKRNRGIHEGQRSRTTKKGDAATGAALSTRRVEASINNGSWAAVSLKVPGQMGSMEGTKWTSIPAVTHYRPQTDPQRWVQEPQAAAWSSVDGDGQMKTTSFSVKGRNTTVSNPAELQWTNHPDVDDEWSGFNGMTAADPSSDWNAPVEHWGNYEEPHVLMAGASLLKDQAVLIKLSDDEKDTDDPSGGAAKSKKRRKKKKKSEEEPASDSQTQSQAPTVSAITKTQELPVWPSNIKNIIISSSQKTSEKTAESQKPSQKKKVRRET